MISSLEQLSVADMTYYELIERNQLGFTVYSPDCINSNLEYHIDKFIMDHTKLYPVYRFIIKHSEKSIEEFYLPNVTKTIPYWHLVSKLFLSGYSLGTFWYGENAIKRLYGVKGKSNPFTAEKDTIRRTFWADSKVCNLIHTSDNISEMIRETEISFRGLNEQVKTDKNCYLFPQKSPRLNHNGHYVFLECILKLCNILNITDYYPELYFKYDSLDMVRALENELKKIIDFTPIEIRRIILKYLEHDEKSIELLHQYGITNPWDEFVIRCSLMHNRGEL